MTPPLAGLSAEEAAARLARDGPNELPTARREGVLRLLVEVVTEPMLRVGHDLGIFVQKHC